MDSPCRKDQLRWLVLMDWHNLKWTIWGKKIHDFFFSRKITITDFIMILFHVGFTILQVTEHYTNPVTQYKMAHI